MSSVAFSHDCFAVYWGHNRWPHDGGGPATAAQKPCSCAPGPPTSEPPAPPLAPPPQQSRPSQLQLRSPQRHTFGWCQLQEIVAPLMPRRFPSPSWGTDGCKSPPPSGGLVGCQSLPPSGGLQLPPPSGGLQLPPPSEGLQSLPPSRGLQSPPPQ